MTGLCKIEEVQSLDPAFAAGETFTAEIRVKDGILEGLDFVLDGDHDTLITNDGEDGVVNLIQSLRVQIPRRNRPEAEWNWRPRDLKHMNHHHRRVQANRAITLADLGQHNGKFHIPFVLPPHLTRSPEERGIDSREIDGPILISGRYGVATDLGVGATVVRNRTRISTCVRNRNPAMPPSVFLVGNSQRIAHESAGELGPTRVSTGVLESLYAMQIRVMNQSAEPDGRTDRMITRFEIKHSFDGLLNDENWQAVVKRGQEFHGIPQAEIQEGIGMLVFAQSGQLEDMPVMSGQTLDIQHNSEEALPNEFLPRITIATGDHFFANTIGVMLTEAGVVRAQNAREQLRRIRRGA